MATTNVTGGGTQTNTFQRLLTWGVLLRQNIPGCYQLKNNLQKSGNNNDGNNEYNRKWFTDEFFFFLKAGNAPRFGYR